MTDAELEQCRHDGGLLFAIVARKVTLKREGGGWKGLCPFHNEKTPSFVVCADGHYHCFGCGAHGTSFDFIMASERVGFSAAIERVAAERGIASSKPGKSGNGAHHGAIWQPMVPPPSDAPKPTEVQLHCDILHEYFDVDDRLLCCVRRIEAKGAKRKQFLPLTFGILDGKRGWHNKAPDTPKPLYGLNRLSHAASDAIVLLVEGEKAADAAQRLLPDHVCMSWMGGANADGAANLAPLAGRSVIIWGDADVPGQAAVARLLKRMPNAFIVDTDGLPDGFDAADLERDDVDDPDSWLAARLRRPESNDAGHEPPSKWEAGTPREAWNRGQYPEPDEWPEPVDFLTPRDTGAPRLKERHVPPSLWPFIADTAERMGAAASSVALAAIISCASVISEEWQIQPKRHDFTWREGARLWGAIVGSASILKKARSSP
jgi:CHC2 zinc finger